MESNLQIEKGENFSQANASVKNDMVYCDGSLVGIRFIK